MDLENLAEEGEKFVDAHGGPAGMEKDGSQLEQVATGDGSLLDKAKSAEGDLKEDGLL